MGCPIRKSLGITAILTFPKLIAEYHVLHRLLLPRHSPNALFALDLIQKKTDFSAAALGSWNNLEALILNQKHTFPAWLAPDFECSVRNTRVSVLDLDNTVHFSQGYF